MKITFLTVEWTQSTKGSCSTFMRQMAIELSRLENVEIGILIPSASPEDKEDAQKYNIKVFESEKILGFEPIFCLQFPPQGFSTDFIIGQGNELVHVGQALKNELSCKWVYLVLENSVKISLFTKVPPTMSSMAELFEIESNLCKKADMVITVGSKLNNTLSSILHQCKEDHIFNLIPGIFDELFGEQKQCRNSRTFEILVFVRGNTEGLRVAAEAVAHLNKYEPSYILKVGVPEGEQEKLALRLQGFGISRSQLIVRSLSNERRKLAQLFSEVDLVLMPSAGTEAFGLTALEALSAGVPILITHNSGLAKALEEVPFGHRCIVHQEADWAEKIKQARKNLETGLYEASMLRDNYKERYSWWDQCAAFVKKLRTLHSGHAEEMQQESQGKRHSAQKQVAASSSTKGKQEKESGSAAKRFQHVTIGEPETSGVSSTSETGKFKVPMEGVMSQLVDVKKEPDTVQHLELKKGLLSDVEVIARGEVTEKGNVWNLPEAAAYVTFHEGAVPKPLLFTCSVWPPKLRSPPISSDELLVSNVIELSHDGPPDLELSGDDEGNVTVALLHSASDLKGYEVVIKQLVDLHDNEWKDLETWHASEKPEVSDWPQLVEATCNPSRFSSFAAVWRLKSFTFTSGTLVVPQFICVVPDFPDIRVEVPLGSGAADQDFTLTIKVQEFPSSEVEDIGILCGPVIHISSSQNIEHMEPVTIKVPLALRESKHDLSELSNEVIRISYLDSKGKQWRDITGQLEGPVTVKDGIVEFKVKHFCCFCPVCLFNKSVALLEDLFHRLSFRSTPQCVHFLTCLCKTPVPDTYSLSLYCYPNFKKPEVEKKSSSYDTPYKGEGKSKERACVGDGIVVSPIALDFVRESQRNEKIVLRFLGDDISDNSDMTLHVRLNSEIAPTVKFSKDEEQQKLLCEVPFLKTRPASEVPVTESRDQRVAPEERPALVADVEKEEKDNEDQCNPRVKQGTPSDDELEYLASKLGDLWKKLGRRLKILEPKLDDLNKLNEALSEKGYKMLMHWKEVNGSAATYEILAHALLDRLVNRRDLAEEFCYEKQ